ncbi:MAG: phytanoyl-CoA dioxygenase family protein [Dermatophilaceae bacterium]
MLPPADLAERVREDGVGQWPGFATGAALEGLRDDAARLATGPGALHFPTSTRVWDLHMHGPRFVELLDHTGLADLLDDLLGPGHLLSDHSLNVVHHGGRADRWHVDYPYNEMRDLTDGPILAVQCILALDDFTPDNGATCHLPRSHRPPRRPPPDLDADGPPLLADAGTLTVLAAATWHRSGQNTTATPRAAVLLSFVEGWIRPMAGPPEPGPWAHDTRTRRLLGLERPPETIDDHPVAGPSDVLR